MRANCLRIGMPNFQSDAPCGDVSSCVKVLKPDWGTVRQETSTRLPRAVCKPQQADCQSAAGSQPAPQRGFAASGQRSAFSIQLLNPLREHAFDFRRSLLTEIVAASCAKSEA